MNIYNAGTERRIHHDEERGMSVTIMRPAFSRGCYTIIRGSPVFTALDVLSSDQVDV